jgi:mRNA interferase MazF
VKRGEIWVGAGSRGYPSKPRPHVIIQDDQFDGTDSITVCSMTSTEAPLPLPLLRVPVPVDPVSGLDLPSWVMVDKINTLRRAQVTRLVGRLTARQLVDVERLLLVFLGMAR